jgi:hypothetical protein
MVSFSKYFTVCITYQPPLLHHNARKEQYITDRSAQEVGVAGVKSYQSEKEIEKLGSVPFQQPHVLRQFLTVNSKT